jgi:LacI family transcriptional regulator
MSSPPLTTVEQPLREMGHRAIDLLISRLRQDDDEVRHVRLETRLVERASTAPPRPTDD